MPPEDIEFVAVYEPIVYYASFMADGKQIGEKVPFTVENTSITEPSVPNKDGFTGKWSTYTLTASDITVNAVYEKIYNPTADAKLIVKSGEVYKNSKVTVIAKATGVPEGYVLAVYDGGNTPVATGDKDRVEYEIPKVVSKTKLLTVKVIDKDDNVQKNANNEELSENIEIKVKSGFFNLIIAFFRRLFRMNSVTIEP
jgi:hypothetical protein